MGGVSGQAWIACLTRSEILTRRGVLAEIIGRCAPLALSGGISKALVRARGCRAISQPSLIY